MPARGGIARRVTDNRRTGRCHRGPAVSPDGRRVAFTYWTTDSLFCRQTESDLLFGVAATCDRKP